MGIATARLNAHALALLFIDLDSFKLINDNLGHNAGDQLLKLSADRIRHCLHTGDVAIRLGADEFLVLLPGIGEPQELVGLIERLQHRLHDPADIAQEGARRSASIGVCLLLAFDRCDQLSRLRCCSPLLTDCVCCLLT
ncbi:diguanylate cyclase domain-containing protein, partial [Aeromonas caviae]|uniref:diguanylate cyclase domain-containing protein n=1 Tax=Aeromonas caviae TaxID=648 RepID=UPI0025B728A8